MSILSHLCIPGLLPCEVGASVSFREVLRVAILLILGQNVSFFWLSIHPHDVEQTETVLLSKCCHLLLRGESQRFFFLQCLCFMQKVLFTHCLDICPQRSTSGSGFCQK